MSFDITHSHILITPEVLGDFGSFTPMTSAAQTVPPAVRTDPIGVFLIGPPSPLTHLSLVTLTTPTAALPAPPVAAPPIPVQIADVSPDTAVTNWSSANISNWPTTPSAFERCESLLKLIKHFSSVNESELLLALELHDHDYEKAFDFLLSMGPKSEIMEFLFEVFPDIPRDVITKRARDNAGRSLPTFSSLVREFHSSWRPIPARSQGVLSLSPPLAYRPDFTADGYLEVEKEAEWWTSTLGTVRWQVTDPAPDNDMWDTVRKACQLDQRTYSPRLADLVQRLYSPEEHGALSVLTTLPAFPLLADLAANDAYRDICANIVLVLASHGMAAPGAIAWAHRYASTRPTYQVSLKAATLNYPKLSSTIWTACNNFLYGWCDQSAGPRLNADVFDVDAESVTSDLTSIADPTPVPSIVEVPISPSVSRVTKTSRGSKKDKTKPYPGAKPPGARRASDDDVRVAQSLAPRPRPLPPADEIIELTSDSDAVAGESELGTPTARRARSPASTSDAPPTIMPPSVVSPRKTRSSKFPYKQLAGPSSKQDKHRKT